MNEGYAFPMTAHLVIELMNRGHEVVVFAVDPQISAPMSYSGDSLTISISPYRTKGRDRAKDLFRAERTFLVEAMQGEQCELIHAHWTYEFALAAQESGIRTLVTLHDWAPTILRFHRDPYRLVRLAMSMKAISRGRHFTATSPYIAQKLKRWRPNVPVDVVPNAVPDEYFKSSHRPRLNDLAIGSISNGFDRLKNTVTLLRAFAEIRSRDANATLALVGAGHEERGPAHVWAGEHRLTEGVNFIGRLSPADIRPFLDSINMYVHPSLEESFGMTIVEAMAMRLPVVAGRNSGAVPWVLDEGRAGVLVDVTSAREIAESVMNLWKEPDVWDHYSGAGFLYASRTFRFSQAADRYEKAYEHVRSLPDHGKWLEEKNETKG